jgi:hypothetical protein
LRSWIFFGVFLLLGFRLTGERLDTLKLFPSVDFLPPLPETLAATRAGLTNRSGDSQKGHLVFSAENPCRIPVLARHAAFVQRFILSLIISRLSEQVYFYTCRMKKQKEPKRCWRIRGYDSLTPIFDQSVSVGQMTEGNMKELLRVLVAKDLSPHELIGAYAKRGTRISNALLEIRKENLPEKRRTIYTCGNNPWYTADVEICD